MVQNVILIVCIAALLRNTIHVSEDAPLLKTFIKSASDLVIFASLLLEEKQMCEV